MCAYCGADNVICTAEILAPVEVASHEGFLHGTPEVTVVSDPQPVAMVQAFEGVPMQIEATVPFGALLDDEDAQLRGIGGGLIPIAVWLIVSPLLIVAEIYRALSPLLGDVRVQDHPALQMMIQFGIAGGVVLVVVLLMLNYLFFTKSPGLPSFMAIFLVLGAAVAVVDAGAAYALMDNMQTLLEAALVLGFVMAGGLIATCYFSISRRAKTTFAD